MNQLITLMNANITSRIIHPIAVYKSTPVNIDTLMNVLTLMNTHILVNIRAVAMGGGGYWMHTGRRLRAIISCRFFNSEKVTNHSDSRHSHGSYPLTHGFDSDSNYRLGACQV